MLLIPAIDLKNGKCVRLRQGRINEETIFADDPLAVAQRWVNAGARRLHIVDLDGAFSGKPVNIAIIEKIVRAYPHIPIQVGGGIRNEDTISAYLKNGISYVILGTKAVTNPAFVETVCGIFPGKILVSLDARGEQIAIEGWEKTASQSVIAMACHFEQIGIQGIIYTDINRDGMMSGVNVMATIALAQAVKIPVIAAGGVTNLEDIRALATTNVGIFGAITGRAIYQGTLDFAAGQRLADELTKK